MLAAETIDWTTILMAIIALIGTLFTPLVTLYVGSKINASVDKNKAVSVETNEGMKQIHTAVNSGAEKIQAELKAVRDENAKLESIVATLAEKVRAEDERKRDKVIAGAATTAEHARAGSEGAAAPVVPTTGVVAVLQPGAVVEVKGAEAKKQQGGT